MGVDLFAAGDGIAGDARTAALVVIGGVIGSAAQWLFIQVREVWRERRGIKAAEQKTITDHLEKVVARLEAENVAIGLKHERLQTRVERAEIRGARLAGHVRYLEAVLHGAGVEFVPWVEPVDDPPYPPPRVVRNPTVDAPGDATPVTPEASK